MDSRPDTKLRPSSSAASASLRFGTFLGLVLLAAAGEAAQFTIEGPAGSGQFGSQVVTLPNGNIVVTDPGFDAPGPVANVGAVYLYRPDGTLISTLRGSSANDGIGNGAVVVLTNGNYVVRSPFWRNGASALAGAVTFGSSATGVSGVVSPANSLVGSRPLDRVGGSGVTALSNGNYVVASGNWNNGAIDNAGAVTFGSGISGVSGLVSPQNSLVGSTSGDSVGATLVVDSSVIALSNGNYVVRSPHWNNGSVVAAGAVTFASGTTGISGVVSQDNSLVGTTANDEVGRFGVIGLTNGSYVVCSPSWDNGDAVDAGAVTLGSGFNGISGAISPDNSLVGSAGNDHVGSSCVIALGNGNYVVRSPVWNNGVAVDAGAVTFGSGISGINGAVSPANSLVGGGRDDRIGSGGVTLLSNGNYVVASPLWNNGAIAAAGAVTFGSGISGVTGVVSPANSLVGATADDLVGLSGVTALGNGNYVVQSPRWDDGGAVDAGAATFGSGTGGISGVVSPGNSLIGSTASDFVGDSVVALGNGNYVVRSPVWDNGVTVNAGAVTFGSGAAGISGVVSQANSLVGAATNDEVGGAGVTALSSGNYVVCSSRWDNGASVDAGAVTLGSGVSGISGVVAPENSLIGNAVGDSVGARCVTALSSGDYVVRSPFWANGLAVNAGAITFGSGVLGVTGVVSPVNSLVGTSANDGIGESEVIALGNGNYVTASRFWDNGGAVDAGAITLGLFDGSVDGPLTAENSVLGAAAFQGLSQVFAYDASRNQLAVGQPASNRVVLHRPGQATSTSIVGDTPDPSGSGQPVTFTASVSATPNAPTNGQVTFTASSGESCVDTTPSATTATTAEFSCAITFVNAGSVTVVAEYTGSILHAYSGSGPVTHTTIAGLVFADGFESP